MSWHQKSSFRITITYLFIIIMCYKADAQKQKQLWFRPVQKQNASDHDEVIRVYFDKYGYYYPKPEVPMDSVNFFNPDHPRQKATDTTSGNLFYYFTKSPQRMALLTNGYQITATGDADKDYNHVQDSIIAGLNAQVHSLVRRSNGKTLVFLIHGFNDSNATGEYRKFRQAVRDLGYGSTARPIYIEIFWDGLTAHGGNPAFAGIWAHAQDNTRWVSLALRNLMVRLKDRLPIVVVTHSLGASVGTGALFNTVSKWGKYNDSKIDAELDQLLASAPPMDVRIRLGMLAPAIPGASTFMDFNNRHYRKPYISILENNIERVVIGYNPYDYATTKAFFRSMSILAPHYGATTLGCDYSDNKGQDEVLRVKNELVKLGYGPHIDRLLFTRQFTTDPAGHGTQQHSMEYYIKDTASLKVFFNDIFGN
jgi:hypothetical protein